MKILVIFLTALIPLLVGFIWYNAKIFGTAWMKAADMTEEKTKNVNMGKIFGITFIFSLMLAFIMQVLVVHQVHVTSLFFKQPIDDPSTEAGALYKSIMDLLGNSYRTFKHGSLHGTIAGFFIALPLIGINALFERKGFNYIAINAGYWIVSFALMGGVICAFS